ncbi:MAG: lactate utilization protein [Candidatus Bathyarchaeota archaeon]|nr:lactate utilization protein [Candidatus Bathyarchaeota archaeon]
MGSDYNVLSITKDALERNQFKVLVASSKKDVVDKILGLITSEAKVGVGGSMTIQELGLIEALTQRGNRVIHRWLFERPWSTNA